MAGIALTAAGLVSANEGGVGGVVTALVTALDPPGLVAATLVAAMLLLARRGVHARGPARRLPDVGDDDVRHLVRRPAPARDRARRAPRPAGGSWNTPVGVFGLGSGAAWALTLVLVVWGYDTGAYATGRLIGRRRMLDHISPSKTIEGLAGGLVLATIAAGSAPCSSGSSRGTR